MLLYPYAVQSTHPDKMLWCLQVLEILKIDNSQIVKRPFKEMRVAVSSILEGLNAHSLSASRRPGSIKILNESISILWSSGVGHLGDFANKNQAQLIEHFTKEYKEYPELFTKVILFGPGGVLALGGDIQKRRHYAAHPAPIPTPALIPTSAPLLLGSLKAVTPIERIIANVGCIEASEQNVVQLSLIHISEPTRPY